MKQTIPKKVDVEKIRYEMNLLNEMNLLKRIQHEPEHQKDLQEDGKDEFQ
jgi:hypothetical protein